MNSNRLVRKRNLKEKQTKDMNQKLKEEEMANHHIKKMNDLYCRLLQLAVFDPTQCL